MPPKPKYGKKEIVEAAFQIARQYGIDAVTAREVGSRLGMTVSPIFTVFQRMEELKDAVRELAWNLFCETLAEADGYVPSFKMRGLLLFRFAKEEPGLFRLLFVSEGAQKSFDTMIEMQRELFRKDRQNIRAEYGLTEAETDAVFRHLLVTGFGICSLAVSGVCTLSEEEASELYGSAFSGILMTLKSGNKNLVSRMPEPNGVREEIPFTLPILPQK